MDFLAENFTSIMLTIAIASLFAALISLCKLLKEIISLRKDIQEMDFVLSRKASTRQIKKFVEVNAHKTLSDAQVQSKNFTSVKELQDFSQYKHLAPNDRLNSASLETPESKLRSLVMQEASSINLRKPPLAKGGN
jgi:hypothetical protein